MTLIFCGNDYKYELEGVMKLFIPAARFRHIYTDDNTTDAAGDDFVLISESEKDGAAELAVKADYLGKQTQRVRSLPPGDGSDRELVLSKLLYEAMSELTGIRPKWGVMTGVRPVKRVNRYIAQVQSRIMPTVGERSFSLYVSIPFCPTRCSYCSFISQTIGSGKKLIPLYIDNLCREIRYTGELAARLGLSLDTVYFGGGTPTSFEAEQLARIMGTVSESFDMSRVREYTVEAGRADTITREKLAAIKENGCSRISVNPQTLNNSVLEVIGRRHTAEQFFSAFELARELGFEHINTDIIAGLPTDTPESFASTVDGLIDLGPENITVHTLSIKRAADLNFAGNKSEVLTSPAGVMVDHAAKRLTEAGYQPYYLYRQKNMLENLENIGWSKPGEESLYNIFIMEEIQTILAVGAGASTKLVDLEGGRLERIFNYKHPLEYNKHFDLMIDKKKEIVDFYAEKE